MGLHMNQRDSRSELQNRLDAELRAKAAAKRQTGDEAGPDGVDDSRYIEKTRQTSTTGVVVTVIVLVAVLMIGFFIYQVNRV